MKKIQAIKSALPVNPATASVCIGCIANNNPDSIVLISHGNIFLPKFTTNAVAKQWRRTLTR